MKIGYGMVGPQLMVIAYYDYYDYYDYCLWLLLITINYIIDYSLPIIKYY